MHLVLTHEQADFDAIASSFGVCLLDSSAQAVLPRRINRNVRAFLTLYGKDLPFIEFADLKRQHLGAVTLVDTQTLPTVRGLVPQTHINVIDHHPLGDMDESWSIHIEPLGATTTILVERMQRAGKRLNLIESTLLLLGIYEDTGSLSYAGTSSRDVLAVAWLLDQGANLSLAADFLNHPLSDAQFDLYNALLESVETHFFYGLSVVVAKVVVEEYIDEISTVAHKLRDLLDPDGLFLIVGLKGKVQLVARSTTDLLDVSRVAAVFNGGGHARAAAALIRAGKPDAVYQQLMDQLHQVIKPARTVGEIMSRDPQILAPDVTVQDAAQLMSRFGHEGYPVVQDEQLLGLLTRRAVDRAISHKFYQRAIETIMDVGDFLVHTTDSVQHLQNMMMDTGWGQIPVLDPISKEIIGIVTRTDLLKELANGIQKDPNEGNLGSKLAAVLPAQRLQFLKLVAREAERQGAAMYVVGGFVRDLLLQAPSMDLDLVIEGDAIALAKSLAEMFGGRISSHQRFGTAKWHLDPANSDFRSALMLDNNNVSDLPATLDFVTARTEFYTHPTALPSVRHGSINLDLHRRDFTINTLAIRLDGRYYGQLLDYWGGEKDLKRGLIRVLHSLSFIDDPTRILRAVRLEQRLNFEIETRSLNLLKQALPLMARVSGERIRHEFQLMYAEERLSAVMFRLQELGILAAIHSDLVWTNELAEIVQKGRVFRFPRRWQLATLPERDVMLTTLCLAKYSSEVVRSISRRLHLPNRIERVVIDTTDIMQYLKLWSDRSKPSELAAFLDSKHESAIAVAWIALLQDESGQENLEKYLSNWRFLKPETTGYDLRRMDLPPGPVYSRILDKLRAAWINGEVTSSMEEKTCLQQYIRAEGLKKDGSADNPSDK